MAASHTLTHPLVIPQISKLGVLTLYGYGIRVRMQAGHLEIEDGIGPERYKFRLPRVNHQLKRLVCISEDGFVTLAALKWLSDVGASFVMLDRLGKVRIVTGPASPSEARLRRAQALALGNGTALRIARELIAAKLMGQEAVARGKLNHSATADAINTLRNGLTTADNLDAVRQIESCAACAYWGVWNNVPVLFPRKDAKLVPSHWLRFGTRHSPLTGGPRLAVNPANALLNYTNAVAESECRLAAVACGLDPGLGFIHKDSANRDSLALDLIETIRSEIEGWLLNWILTEPLRRADFHEASDGNCRIRPALCERLSETAPIWGKLVAPWAEFVAHSLYAGGTGRATPVRLLKTPLTQTRRRKAKGAPPATLKMPKAQHVCRGCGKAIREDRENCSSCSVGNATERLRNAAKIGRVAAQSPASRAKHRASRRRHAIRCASWDASKQPAWLTSEFFSKEVQPMLANVRTATIRSRIRVSAWYASKIRQGYRPHPRHWLELAELVKVRNEAQ